MSKHSCLPRSNVLGRVCGTSIDADDVTFAPSANHLVYMDKVYSRVEATACPLVFSLRTNPCSFQTQLLTSPLSMSNENLCEEIFGPLGGYKLPFSDFHKRCRGEVSPIHNGCNNNINSCCNSNIDPCRPNCPPPCPPCKPIAGNACEVDENSVFNIVNSYVLIKNFNTRPLCNLHRTQVTLDGFPVDSLDCQGGSYTAAINTIIPEISQDLCVDRGLPTRTFFLITNVGPWAFDAKFVLEGTVNTNGRMCCFRAIFETNSPIDILPQPGPGPCGCCCDGREADASEYGSPSWNSGTVNFAVPNVSIPCITGGVAPTLNFSFNGNISLLNPSISVQENLGRSSLVLSTRVVAEPSVSVEVVRKTLFCTNACEGLVPCDGTEEAWIANNQHDDISPDFECSCGPRRIAAQPISDSYCGNTIVFGTDAFDDDSVDNSSFGTNSTCNSTCRGF